MKKTIILAGVMLVLASLAAAEIQQAYPELVKIDAELDYQKKTQLFDYLEENSKPVLNNEESVNVLGLEPWIENLRRAPPPAYQRKLANLDKELAQYEERFALGEEEMVKINQLSDEEKAYLVATLGRSIGQKAFFYEGTMGSPMFNYIVFHENFHTFTNPMFTADRQARLVQVNMERASEQREADLLKELDFLKQRAQFLALWKRYVGSEKIVGFSNYGRTNAKEQLSEFFARLNTGYFTRDLREMEPAEDNRELRGYLAAFVLADCAELFESFDMESGAELRKEIIGIIESNPVRKKIYEDLKGDVLRRTSCPMKIPESAMETKEAYECDWERGGAGEIKVTDCELTEVSELSWSPELDSAYLGYDEDGNVVDAGYFKANEIMVTNYLDGEEIMSETQYVSLPEGRMIVEKVPGLETVELFEDSADGLIAQEVEINPRRLARDKALAEAGMGRQADVYDEIEANTGASVMVLGPSEIKNTGIDCIEIRGDASNLEVLIPYTEDPDNVYSLVEDYLETKKGVELNSDNIFDLLRGALLGDETARLQLVDYFRDKI